MSKLLSQGGFGCVFYPGITCEGKTDKSKSYVSKLQIKDETTVNEYKDLQHRDISEYDNFTDEEKRKYHARMMTRKRVEGDTDASNFHNK